MCSWTARGKLSSGCASAISTRGASALCTDTCIMVKLVISIVSNTTEIGRAPCAVHQCCYISDNRQEANSHHNLHKCSINACNGW